MDKSYIECRSCITLKVHPDNKTKTFIVISVISISQYILELVNVYLK